MISNFKVPDISTNVFDKYSEVNRLIVIGNGFDIAHGLNSSFKDFIYNYCLKTVTIFLNELKFEDQLISIKSSSLFSDKNKVLNELTPTLAFKMLNSDFHKNSQIKISWKSGFFQIIMNEVENKKWVDIEIQYFDFLKSILTETSQLNKLNNEFEFIKLKFIEYLSHELTKFSMDASENLLSQFSQKIKLSETIPNTIKNDLIPNKTAFLNFNYTDVAKKYSNYLDNGNCSYIPIHGQLEINNNNFTQEPVFGFGDEMDKDYIKFELFKNNNIFKHIKSFKYLQFNHYRKLIEFIENNPYQIQIFGHSCGLSDRTLLNTIFEHENCISIKPFYHKKNNLDDFEEKTYSISRHFTSKSLLRSKVVNKQYCEAMVQPIRRSNQI